ARAALASAKAQYEDGVKKLKDKMDALPEPENPRAKDPFREELEFAWLDARFKAALSAYFLSQSITDEKSPERKALLEGAGKGFDAIFQEYRSSGKPIAMLPHMWHGKVLEDLGDKVTAMDVYDEVLVLTPDPKEADSKNADLAPLFGQAFLFRLRLIARDEETTPLDIIREGQQWLDAYKGWQATDPYQGIALEVVKAKMTAAERAKGTNEKKKIYGEVAQSLLAMAKIESSYKHEALQIRREALEKSGRDQSLTSDDRLSFVDEAIANKNWVEAEKICREVVADADKKKDTKRLAAAKTRLGQVLYNVAAAAYTANEMDKVHELAKEIVGGNLDQEAAESASSLAVFAALALFTNAKDDKAKATYFTRLDGVARFTIGKWPDGPVGDDARMALAQAHLIKGDYPPALELLGAVTPQSKRYATAMQVLGQIRWNQYFSAKKAPDAADRAEEIAKLRSEAVTSLKTSVDRQQAAITSGDPLPPALFDTQLLLAQTHLEGQQPQEAAALFAPLLAEISRAKPTELNAKIQQTYVGAARSLLAAGSTDQAGDAAVALAKLSPDNTQANAVLVDLAKLMAIEIRKIEAEQAADATAIGTPGAGTSSTAKLREAQGELLDTIVERKSLATAQLIFVGDACVDLGKNQMARDIYSRLLESIDKDAEAKKTAGAAVTRIRSRQVGLLRAEGRLEDANKVVDALLKAHPNALEPMLEKGYILEAIAERNPKRSDESVAHWTELRLRLGKTNPVPPEYFEVLYNCARVLVRQSRALKDKDKALTAEKMLKSTLVLKPKLSGEDMVAKYNTLLKAAILLRGGKLPTPTTSPEGGQNRPITTTPAPAATPATTPASAPKAGAPKSAAPASVPTTPTSAKKP
ncbi:MAG: tetratricopeptide repeat protein, partial [Planctomycetaceae bacterium]|nr:tetratricopeptide repeat protein [Planctomycetaceae bacterium]